MVVMNSVVQFIIAYMCGVILVMGMQAALVTAFGWKVRRVSLFASVPRLCCGPLEIGLAPLGRCAVEHRHPAMLSSADLLRDVLLGLSGPLTALSAFAIADGPLRWAALAVLVMTSRTASSGLRSLAALVGLKAPTAA